MGRDINKKVVKEAVILMYGWLDELTILLKNDIKIADYSDQIKNA